MNWPTLKDDHVRALLAMGIMLVFAVYVFKLTFYGSKLSEYMMGMIVGYLAAILKDVYGYFFGSSSGSKEKQQILNEGKSNG